MRAGAYNMPWTSYVESLYGYRWVEKTASIAWGLPNTARLGRERGAEPSATSGVSYSVSAVDGGGFKNPTRTKTIDVEARVALRSHHRPQHRRRRLPRQIAARSP